MAMSPQDILVIEDDPAIRELLTTALKSKGHLVWCVENGADALRFLTKWTPDLILMELDVSVTEGWEFLEVYRRRFVRYPPVVVCGASVADRERVLAAGAAAYFEQPVDLNRLLQMVDAPFHHIGRTL